MLAYISGTWREGFGFDFSVYSLLQKFRWYRGRRYMWLSFHRLSVVGEIGPLIMAISRTVERQWVRFLTSLQHLTFSATTIISHADSYRIEPNTLELIR